MNFYMKKKLDFAIVGGDMRQVKLAKLLSDDGHRVFAYALEAADISENIIPITDISDLSENVDCVILPLPAKSGKGFLNAPFSEREVKIEDIFTILPMGQTVIGGKLDNSLFEMAGRCGIRLFDCLEREDFTVMNSVPTAEGAIACAMEHQKTTLNSSHCLILGYGHIGKLLAAYLKGLGADITVSARKSGDIAWISAYGYKPILTSDIKKNLSDFDIIFNTIPALILDREALLEVSPDAFICDLAALPGGVDFPAAQALSLRTCHALSLPGKVAPVTAAKSLRATVYNILNEWGK